MTTERLAALDIPMMIPDQQNTSGFGTGFTVTVEAKTGVTTGISAADRAHTVKTLIDPATTAADIARPGHMFPLRALDGGVLTRNGHTEAAVDLSRLAGLYPAGVICEVMADDGTMMRLPALEVFAATHDLKIISIDDLIAYRQQTEQPVERIAEATLPTTFGDFRALVYHESKTNKDHIALIAGEVADVPLVRIHSECLTGDAFGSTRCDCGPHLEEAQRLVSAENGLILYLRQEGRGIGLVNKIKAYALQDEGLDTVEANVELGFSADLRTYNIAAQMLHDLGIKQIRLLTNNPAKISGLEQYGVQVVERRPLIIPPNPNNDHYLNTKRNKMNHLI